MEFDYDSERCFDCDGHWRHFAGCVHYTGEPFLALEQRVELRALIDAL